MIGPNFMDEIDCGSFFDHIDDLLDFPDDNNNNSELVGGNYDSFSSLWSNSNDMILGSDQVPSEKNSNISSNLSAELSVPYEDIVQLEWLSNFVEDSFSGGSIAVEKGNSSIIKNSTHNNHFHTSSPVSVLESSSSCSGKTLPICPKTIAPARHGRPRSKRPRPATFSPRPSMQLISPTSSFTDTPRPFLSHESQNFGESHPSIKIPRPGSGEHKKKKIKILPPSLDLGETNQNFQPSQAVRKCMHCEITKTPQWRAGPLGPKTLCNACGVRYKSGRLFPEYRPAASPTFVPTIHSNSHKKVVEMRSKGCETTMAEPATPPPEFIPNGNPVLNDYI